MAGYRLEISDRYTLQHWIGNLSTFFFLVAAFENGS